MNTTAVMNDVTVETKKTPLIHKILIVAGMMTLMGGSLTGVMTYINLGYSETFVSDWIRSFLTAACTIMPLGFVMMALITKLAEKLLPNMREKSRNLIVGITMACIMESGMAFTTAYNTIGMSDQGAFFSAWFDGLLAALPVALTLMIIVSMTIKPKIEQLLKS